MDGSAEIIIRSFVILLSVAVGSIAYRWLFPGLDRAAKGLATLLLAVQLLVIGISLTIDPSSSFESWFWHLDREWNLPATLASAQLALVAFVALATAWLSKLNPAWRRLHLAGIGVVFLFLAYDEYAVLHERILGWKELYFVLGVAVVIATLAVAARSPKHTWISYASFLTGLAMSAAGGLLFEASCGHEIFEVINGCKRHYWVEEPLEFLGMWLALIAMLIQFVGLSPPPSTRVRRGLFAFPALWLFLLAISPAIYPVKLYANEANSADVTFESGLQLRGHLMQKRQRHIHLFLSPGRGDYAGLNLSGLGYSIHLVDQVSGASVSSRDRYAHRHFFMLGPRYIPIYRQWVEVERSPQTPTNRAYWIVLTLWRDEGAGWAPQKIVSSDHQLLDDSQVILDELVLRSASTESPGDPVAIFDNGFKLAAAELPEKSQAGQALRVTFSWRAENSGEEDHAQFLHLGHAESGEWFVYDQAPMGERLPTRLWYRGLADSETWHVPLPADLAPGRYHVFTGIYRARDRERVPARNVDGSSFLDFRVPLGSLEIE